jgi:hypothetical protein
MTRPMKNSSELPAVMDRVGLLLTPAPSTPPDGVEFRSMDAQHITTLYGLFDAFAKAWNFPDSFVISPTGCHSCRVRTRAWTTTSSAQTRVTHIGSPSESDQRRLGYRRLPKPRRFSLSRPVMGRWDSCCDGLPLVNPTAEHWWPWSKAWSPG